MDFVLNESEYDDNIDDQMDDDNVGDEHDIITIDDDEIKPIPKKPDNSNLDDEEKEEYDDDIDSVEPILEDDMVEILSNTEIIIKPENRVSSEYMSRYEFVKLVGVRATQISQGSIVFTNIDNLSDPIEMAIKEVYDNKCPLIVKRYIGLNKYEMWTARELIKKNYK